MSFLNKRVEESMKQAKLLIQMNEIIYAVNNYVIMNDNIRRLRD